MKKKVLTVFAIACLATFAACNARGDNELPDKQENVSSEQGTATPIPTSEPETTATPIPTPEPETTATPIPTPEPETTATPVPTPEPEATATPVPTPEPTTTGTADAEEGKLLALEELPVSDAAFREFIGENYDKNQDGFLSERERNEVLSIETNKQYDIDHVDGLEIFPNLESLFFWGSVRKAVIKSHPSLRNVGGTEGFIDELLIENCPKLEGVGFAIYGLGDVTISGSGQKVSFGVDEPLELGKLTFDENVIVALTDGYSGAELFFVQEDGSLHGRQISREGEETEQVVFEKPAMGVPFDEEKIKEALKSSVFVIGERSSQENGQNVEGEGYRIEIKESPTKGKWNVILAYPYRDRHRGYIIGKTTFVMEADERPEPDRFYFTVAELDDRVRYRVYSPKWGLTVGFSCSLNLMYATDAGEQYVATITAQEKICLILPMDLNGEEEWKAVQPQRETER